MFYRNRTNFEIIFYTLRGILTKNKQTYVCHRLDFLFADFTASSLLERIVLSGSDFAYSLYGRLRVVPHFSSGIVERAKRERA